MTSISRVLVALATVLCTAAPALARQTRFLALLAAWVARHADPAGRLPVPGPEPLAVRRALDILSERYDEDLDLAELARLVGLSPWHLARVVARQTGLPPHAHLLARRLVTARERLRGA